MPAKDLQLSTCLLLQDAMASFATAAISVGLLVSASAHAANDNVWWLVRNPRARRAANCVLSLDWPALLCPSCLRAASAALGWRVPAPHARAFADTCVATCRTCRTACGRWSSCGRWRFTTCRECRFD